jgi:multidrug efflux pump subunit AcrB
MAWSLAPPSPNCATPFYQVEVIGRSEDAERGSLETLQSLQIVNPSGTSTPLLAFATVRFELEKPLIWRRDRKPTITLKAAVVGDRQAAELVAALAPRIAEFAGRLPANYSVATGSALEESARAQTPILRVVPLMVLLMATILMVQLHSLRKLFLVVSVAPLGLVGVVVALVSTAAPLVRGDPRGAGTGRHHHSQCRDPRDIRSRCSSVPAIPPGRRWPKPPGIGAARFCSRRGPVWA